MNGNRMCIIPCGSAKIWDANPGAGPQKAEDVYTGVFAAACQRYARVFFDHWVILSAKHGFLFPTDIVPEPYNVSFIKPSTETITLQELKLQAAEKGLLQFNEITVLGGKHYVDRVTAIFNMGQHIDLPLHNCKGIGYMLQRVTLALESTEPILDSPLIITAMKRVRENVGEAPLVGKYSPLYHHLRTEIDASVTLTIEQIEDIVGFSLPASSTKHRAWWANDLNHSQAKAWMLANYEVSEVSMPRIMFNRISD